MKHQHGVWLGCMECQFGTRAVRLTIQESTLSACHMLFLRAMTSKASERFVWAVQTQRFGAGPSRLRDRASWPARPGQTA